MNMTFTISKKRYEESFHIKSHLLSSLKFKSSVNKIVPYHDFNRRLYYLHRTVTCVSSLPLIKLSHYQYFTNGDSILIHFDKLRLSLSKSKYVSVSNTNILFLRRIYMSLLLMFQNKYSVIILFVQSLYFRQCSFLHLFSLASLLWILLSFFKIFLSFILRIFVVHPLVDLYTYIYQTH